MTDQGGEQEVSDNIDLHLLIANFFFLNSMYLGFILDRSNCIVLWSFVHELPKGEIVRILRVLAKFIGWTKLWVH